MNKGPNLLSRTSRPQSLGGAFGGLLRIFGARASDADLSARWDEIIGSDLSRIGKLAGIRAITNKQFNITLKAPVSAMAMELSYRKEEFREKINKYFGYEAVGKIIVKA